MYTAGRADADDAFNAERAEQFVRIDPDGRHAHAARHDGDTFSLIVSGISLNAAHIIHQFRTVKEGVGDHFGAERIPRHQNGFGEVFGAADDMRSQIELLHGNLLIIMTSDGIIIYKSARLNKEIA